MAKKPKKLRDEIIITKAQCIKLLEYMEANDADAFSFDRHDIGHSLNQICPYDIYDPKDIPTDLN
jgi:hypothetical protein